MHPTPTFATDAPPQLWLVGGTTESFELSKLVVQQSLSCVVSVTTDVTRYRYPCSPLLQICIQRFNSETLNQFLVTQNIRAILDASHPHAVEISRLAIQAANNWQIPYLRWERPLVTELTPQVQKMENLQAVLAPEHLCEQRVLLTIGAKALHHFYPWQARSTLFARILPSEMALQAAASAGFMPKRLIALRPPISVELEIALWQQWNIERVVTKASGQPGGETVKRQAAEALGIPLLVIQRPQIVYPQQTRDLDVAIAFCQQALQQQSP